MRNLLERVCRDPVYFAYRIIGYGLVTVLLVLTLGCASSRYLSEDEDAQMREICGESKYCTVLPNSDWEQLERLLHRCLGI